MSSAKILEIGFKRLLAFILSVVFISTGYSQASKNVKLLEFKYGFQAPMADLKTRFGGSNDLGLSLQFASLTHTTFIGVEGIFFFGSTVKEDVLANLRTFDGNIIGIQGAIGDVSLKERGFYAGLDAGKIFKTTKVENNLTGIRAQVGAGLLQHKIRVQDNANNIPSLDKKYIKGYDRLTNGPAVHLSIGYQYENPNNNFHFNLMGDIYGSRTASRRDYDNMTGGYLDEKRTDILAGLTISYIVSISRTDKADHIYY
ncbi:MAG: hypothetical protein IPP15_03590 [Saprospiraceae bacterium]|uniref:Uncharacterized protein n=1 Tax=Candidatus Opimibacter skivensis TaxID=2982028 RepID=A0A9D7ST34_9BACT|nr:hypothetical protein [Candidatus Opimibacter skivensis]